MVETIPVSWNNILSKIEKEDLYTADDAEYGLETEPHVTILYGIHDYVELPDFISLLPKSEQFKLSIFQASVFQNELYDVVKFDISDENNLLGITNNKLRSTIPYTNSYPEYHAHMTVAYVKCGKGQEYADMYNKYLNDKADNLVPTDVTKMVAGQYIYSTTTGKKTKFTI